MVSSFISYAGIYRYLSKIRIDDYHVVIALVSAKHPTQNILCVERMNFLPKNADRLEIEFHYCPLLKAWQDLGFDAATCEKLCDMAMDGDRNIAKAMGYEFHLGDTIAKGCKTCQISFFKKDQ